MEAVEVNELRRVITPRKREPVVALDAISLTIPVGEVHGPLRGGGVGTGSASASVGSNAISTDLDDGLAGIRARL